MTNDLIKNSSMAPNFKMMSDGAKAIANIHTAVAEFVDNSFDAKASNIQLVTYGKDRTYDLYIKDDGCGIQFHKLLESLKGGTYSDKSNTTQGTFGCKGVGLKYASIYLALSSCKVYSKCKEDGDKINYGSIDLDSIHNSEGANNWNSIYKINQLDLNEIEDEQIYQWLVNNKSGTVVKLTKMNSEVCGSKDKFDEAIYGYQRGMAHMYRHILKQRSTSLTLNGDTFTPKGPGFGHKEPFQDKVFFKNDVRYHSDSDGWIPHTVNLADNTSYDVKFRFIRISSPTSLGTNADSYKGGLLILREMRGVTTQKLSGFKDKNWQTGHLVIELSCPASFIDRTLTFNGDKQIRSVESKLSFFDFKKHFKLQFKKYQKEIILINKNDALTNGSDLEKRKATDLAEKEIVRRFIEQKIEAYQEDHTEEEIRSWIEEEYCPQGSNSRIDLVWKDTPFEFKKEVTNINSVVGQILCYIPFLIKEERFVNDNNECCFKLAIYSKPSQNLKNLIEVVNDTCVFDGVKVNITLIDLHKEYSKLFSYPKTSEEKQRTVLAA